SVTPLELGVMPQPSSHQHVCVSGCVCQRVQALPTLHLCVCVCVCVSTIKSSNSSPFLLLAVLLSSSPYISCSSSLSVSISVFSPSHSPCLSVFLSLPCLSLFLSLSHSLRLSP